MSEKRTPRYQWDAPRDPRAPLPVNLPHVQAVCYRDPLAQQILDEQQKDTFESPENFLLSPLEETPLIMGEPLQDIFEPLDPFSQDFMTKEEQMILAIQMSLSEELTPPQTPAFVPEQVVIPSKPSEEDEMLTLALKMSLKDTEEVTTQTPVSVQEPQASSSREPTLIPKYKFKDLFSVVCLLVRDIGSNTFAFVELSHEQGQELSFFLPYSVVTSSTEQDHEDALQDLLHRYFGFQLPEEGLKIIDEASMEYFIGDTNSYQVSSVTRTVYFLEINQLSYPRRSGVQWFPLAIDVDRRIWGPENIRELMTRASGPDSHPSFPEMNRSRATAWIGDFFSRFFSAGKRVNLQAWIGMTIRDFEVFYAFFAEQVFPSLEMTYAIFCNVMAKFGVFSSLTTEDQRSRLFCAFDADNKGFVSFQQLVKYLFFLDANFDTNNQSVREQRAEFVYRYFRGREPIFDKFCLARYLQSMDPSLSDLDAHNEAEQILMPFEDQLEERTGISLDLWVVLYGTEMIQGVDTALFIPNFSFKQALTFEYF